MKPPAPAWHLDRTPTRLNPNLSPPNSSSTHNKPLQGPTWHPAPTMTATALRPNLPKQPKHKYAYDQVNRRVAFLFVTTKLP